MIGYVYCTITEDDCYYIGQHKRSKFNKKYTGSGKMLKGKRIKDCYMIDSAETLIELNKKELYWIKKCVGKYGSRCINLGCRASNGTQKYIVNRHDHSEVYTDMELFSSKFNISKQTASKWVYRFNEGSRGLSKFKGKRLKPVHKKLIEDWILMPASVYLKKFS
jgi:hypothetical protein